MKYLEKEHNWDIHVKTNYGTDAYYYYAKTYKHNEIIKYLENKMFYEKLSKLANQFVEQNNFLKKSCDKKDDEINALIEKIDLVKKLCPTF